MIMVNFKKGDKIEYIGSTPFILGNSQYFTYQFEVQEAISDVDGQEESFRLFQEDTEASEESEDTDTTLDELHEEALAINDELNVVKVETIVTEKKVK